MGDDISLLPAAAPIELIDEHGTVTEHDHYPLPTAERLLDAYAGLVTGRRINEQCNALVRQGRLAVYPSSHGQEACQVAAASAIRETDWLFPTYRDTVAVIQRGVPADETIVELRGDWHIGYDPIAHRVGPQTTPLATQLLHAVGVAQAAQFRGEDTVVIAMCGDGATSEGDFHEALNFAAVFHVPVVFFVQNNEFAISVPLSRQTAAPSLAHKAIGYGMPGERVDGNDVAALLSVLGVAVDRARAGGGPTLIEAHTYRMQAHTNADDDTRYREREEVQRWLDRDPLTRVRTYLRTAGVLTDEHETEFARAADAVATELREATGRQLDLDPEELFAHVYTERPPMLESQWQLLHDEITRTEAAV